jgi:hypothetical protein
MWPARCLRITGRTARVTFSRADEVGGQLTLDLLGRQLLEVAEVAVGGVVDQHVNPPEPLDGGLHGGLRVVGTGDVELDHQHVIRLTVDLTDRRTLSVLRPVATTAWPAARAALAMSTPMPRPALVMNHTFLSVMSSLLRC